MTSPPPEFSRMVAVERIDRRGLTRDIEANEAERAALARRFDLISIESFRASVRLRAVNGGTAIRLDGHVDAAVTQRCVVTLGPVPETVSSDFVLLFTREEPGEEVDVAFEDEIVEPLEGSEIDIGEASAQELAVALEPYPRADGVSLETIASPEALADLESLDGPESPDRPESLQGPESLDGEEGRLHEAAEPDQRPPSAPPRPRGVTGGRED
jgi:uncharacterized metal-binding protein YceD (DUF177 family)